MVQPAKFDFGTVFDGLVEDRDDYAEEKEPTWSAEEVEQERASAFAQGREAGRKDALEGIENRIASTVEQLLAQAKATLGRLDTVERDLASQAKILSLTIGRAIASELLSRSHAQEIEAIVSEALGFLIHQPHVVVRVHEELLEGLKERLEAVARARGFAGNLIILAEPDMERPDCRIEWAEGGITRDTAAVAARVEDIVRRHLAPGHAALVQRDLFHQAPEIADLATQPSEETTE